MSGLRKKQLIQESLKNMVKNMISIFKFYAFYLRAIEKFHNVRTV